MAYLRGDMGFFSLEKPHENFLVEGSALWRDPASECDALQHFFFTQISLFFCSEDHLTYPSEDRPGDRTPSGADVFRD